MVPVIELSGPIRMPPPIVTARPPNQRTADGCRPRRRICRAPQHAVKNEKDDDCGDEERCADRERAHDAEEKARTREQCEYRRVSIAPPRNELHSDGESRRPERYENEIELLRLDDLPVARSRSQIRGERHYGDGARDDGNDRDAQCPDHARVSGRYLMRCGCQSAPCSLRMNSS